jgi:hypothetical protein
LVEAGGCYFFMTTVIIPEPLKPILDFMFGVGAIILFGEIIVVLYRAVTLRFTPAHIAKLFVYGFLLAICLDWVAGFNFFKDTIAPAVWNMLNGIGNT